MLCIIFNIIAIVLIAHFAQLCMRVGILFTWKSFAWPTHFTVRGDVGTYNFHSFATFHWSARTKPESEMSCVGVTGIDFVFIYGNDIWFWNCSHSVVICFRFIAYYIFIIVWYTTHLLLGIWSVMWHSAIQTIIYVYFTIANTYYKCQYGTHNIHITIK